MLKLMLVGGFVEVAARLEDQVVGANLPNFEAADVNATAGSTGAGVGAVEGPVENRMIFLDEEIIHREMEIGEGGHEAAGDFGDG